MSYLGLCFPVCQIGALYTTRGCHELCASGHFAQHEVTPTEAADGCGAALASPLSTELQGQRHVADTLGH